LKEHTTLVIWQLHKSMMSAFEKDGKLRKIRYTAMRFQILCELKKQPNNHKTK